MKTPAEIVESIRALFVEDAAATRFQFEAGKEARLECGRPGTFRDMHGNHATFTAENLAAMAESFVPGDGDHQLKLGHKPIETDSPHLGDISRLEYDPERQRLNAFAVPTEFAVEKNRKEGFSRCSMELLAEGGSGSGPFMFQHLGLLAAAKPAIKGLSPVKLAEAGGAGVFVFAEGDEDERAEILLRNFDANARKKAAKSGAAMPDGSFPIMNEGDLKNAIQAIGRASDPAAAKAHIKMRAKAMGLSKLVPSDWSEMTGLDSGANLDTEEKTTEKAEMEAAERLKLTEAEADRDRYRKLVSEGAKDRAKTFMAANVKRIPMALVKAGLEARLAAAYALEAEAGAVLKFSVDGKEASESFAGALVTILSALPEQTSTNEETEQAKKGAERGQRTEIRLGAGLHADPQSVEMDFAIEQEIEAVKGKTGKVIQYAEAARRVAERAGK